MYLTCPLQMRSHCMNDFDFYIPLHSKRQYQIYEIAMCIEKESQRQEFR
jgi:hypothetical protein